MVSARKKRFSARSPLVLAIVAALVLAACGTDDPDDDVVEPDDTEEPADDEPADDEPADDEPADDEPADDAAADGPTITDGAEITMWFGREDFIPDHGFDAFTEETGIVVNAEVVPIEQVPADMARVAGTAQSPDVSHMHDFLAGPLADGGAFRDMSDMWEIWEQENPEHFNEMADVAIEGATYNGVNYGLALHAGAFWYVYRQDLFDEAGLDVPETLEEVLEAGRILGESDGMLGFATNADRSATSGIFMGSFTMAGGEYDDAGLPQFDTEAGHYALEWWRALAEEGIADTNLVGWTAGDHRAAFIRGEAAQAFIGENIWSAIQEELEFGEEWNSNFDTLYGPGGAATSALTGGAWPYFVSADTEYPYEVSLALRYLAEVEQAETIARRYQPTTNLAVLQSASYEEVKPWGPQMFDIWQDLEMRPTHPSGSELNEVIFDMLHAVLLDFDADVAEVAAEHQARIDALED